MNWYTGKSNNDIIKIKIKKPLPSRSWGNHTWIVHKDLSLFHAPAKSIEDFIKRTKRSKSQIQNIQSCTIWVQSIMVYSPNSKWLNNMSSEGDICKMNTLKKCPCSKFSGTAACICHIEEKQYFVHLNLTSCSKRKK